MAFVKLLCGRVGDGFDHRPGQVIEVGDEEAARMVKGNYALSATAETASTAPPENAARAAAAAPRRPTVKKKSG